MSCGSSICVVIVMCSFIIRCNHMVFLIWQLVELWFLLCFLLLLAITNNGAVSLGSYTYIFFSI